MSRRTINGGLLGRRHLALEVRTLPDAARDAIAELLPQVLSILPGEVVSLILEYQNDATTANLQCVVHPDYDTLTIRLFPRWLSLSRAEQRRDLCHEIAHAWLARVLGEQHRTIEAFIADPAARRYALDRSSHEQERLAERLGALLAEACLLFPPVEVP